MTRTRVPRRAVFSLLIALGGIAALFYTGLSASAYMLMGGAAVIVSVLFSSWSAVYAKREISNVNPLLSTTIQFAVSAVLLFLGSLLVERDRPSDWNLSSVLALLFLSVFGSIIAFSLYYWLLTQLEAYQVSTSNLIVPIVAIAEGALLLRERVPLLMIGAAVLVLVAVAAVLRAEDESSLALRIDVPTEH
jgi:drug/metabolite transporter (DMT)-like permease